MHYFSYFCSKTIDCWYSLELPWRNGSNEYPQSIFKQKYEKCQKFLSENFYYLEVKFSLYLNNVFVMIRCSSTYITLSFDHSLRCPKTALGPFSFVERHMNYAGTAYITD